MEAIHQKALVNMATAVIVLQCETEEDLVGLLAEEKDQDKAPKAYFEGVAVALEKQYGRTDLRTIMTTWIDHQGDTFGQEFDTGLFGTI